MSNNQYFGQETFFNENVKFYKDVEISGNISGSLTGNVVGNLTGNVVGNVTGNLTGNLTGNVTGNVTGNINSPTLSSFKDVKIDSKLYDGNNVFGLSNQLLSSDGTKTVWINSSSTNVASSVVLRDSSGNFSTGIVTATSVNDSNGNVRNVAQNSQTGAYILSASDSGKHISITTGGVTVPANVFSVGDAVSIYNNSVSNQTITQGGSVTLRQAATTNTGNRTLAQYGLCTVLCVSTNTFVISGIGLT